MHEFGCSIILTLFFITLRLWLKLIEANLFLPVLLSFSLLSFPFSISSLFIILSSNNKFEFFLIFESSKYLSFKLSNLCVLDIVFDEVLKITFDDLLCVSVSLFKYFFKAIKAKGMVKRFLKFFIFSDLLYSSNNVIGIWLFVDRVIHGWFKALNGSYLNIGSNLHNFRNKFRAKSGIWIENLHKHFCVINLLTYSFLVWLPE